MFQKVLQSPAIRELRAHGAHGDMRTKRWQTLEAIVANIQSYLTGVLACKTKKHKGGQRTTVNQQTYRTILAACVGKNLVKLRGLTEASVLLVSCFTWR